MVSRPSSNVISCSGCKRSTGRPNRMYWIFPGRIRKGKRVFNESRLVIEAGSAGHPVRIERVARKRLVYASYRAEGGPALITRRRERWQPGVSAQARQIQNRER